MSACSEVQALAALASQEPWLFALLVAFNYRPADYVHLTRRPASACADNDALWLHPRARTALSELLLRELALHDRPCVDTRRPELTQALLEPARLHVLALAVGGVVLSPRIRRSIARDAVLRWKETLTPRLYTFAMQGAPLLPLGGLLPREPEDLPADELGYRWVAASLGDAPDALRQRALLKLPAAAQSDIEPARARQVVQCIHANLEPRWCSSFATRR